MNPPQLRETTMDPDTRRLVQLVLDEDGDTDSTFDLLLAKKRAGDRKTWRNQRRPRHIARITPPLPGTPALLPLSSPAGRVLTVILLW